jgi:citrate synthase
MSTAAAGKGLEGIVAANSGICWIDGDAGVLSYRGIDIHELADHSTFEETTYLLWNGILPNALQLREFQSQLTLARSLDHRQPAAQHSRLGHPHGGAAHGGLGAQLL